MMQVSGPAFFSADEYRPILEKCEKIKKSESYRFSKIIKEKTDVIYKLFTESVLQRVVLNDFLNCLTEAFNSIIERVATLSVFEFEEKGRLEFFNNELRQPIVAFLDWFKAETARLSEMQKLIDFSKAMSLASLTDKVKGIVSQYPLKLGDIFVQIFDYEEIEENNEILTFKPLEDRAVKLVHEMEKVRKEAHGKQQCLEIATLSQNLMSTQLQLHEKYTDFMTKKQEKVGSFFNHQGKDFVGKEGYFKDKTYKTIPLRWLGDMLPYAVASDWEKIAEHTGKLQSIYQTSLNSLRERNKFLKKHGSFIAGYLAQLSNEAIDFADASGAESKDGTVGGNRSLVSAFSHEGLSGMRRMEARKWPFFGKRTLVEGLYYSYCFLIALESAENSRKKILGAIGESTSNDDFFSPRPEEPTLTTRFNHPPANLNEQLIVKPNIDGTLLNQTFFYIQALKQASNSLRVAKENSYFCELATGVRLSIEHVLTTFEKNIRILQEQLDAQNFDL